MTVSLLTPAADVIVSDSAIVVDAPAKAKRTTAVKPKAAPLAVTPAPADTAAPAIDATPARPVDIVNASRVKAGLSAAIAASASKGHVHPLFASWLSEDYGLALTAKSRDFLQKAINLLAVPFSLTADADKAGVKDGRVTYLVSDAATIRSAGKLARMLHAYISELAPNVKGAPAVPALADWAVYKAPAPKKAKAAPAPAAVGDDADAEAEAETIAAPAKAKAKPCAFDAASKAINAAIAEFRSGTATALQRDSLIALAYDMIAAAEIAATIEA